MLTGVIEVVVRGNGLLVVGEVTFVYGLFDLIVGSFGVQVHGP